jgi:hypothetical protein
VGPARHLSVAHWQVGGGSDAGGHRRGRRAWAWFTVGGGPTSRGFNCGRRPPRSDPSTESGAPRHPWTRCTNEGFGLGRPCAALRRGVAFAFGLLCLLLHVSQPEERSARFGLGLLNNSRRRRRPGDGRKTLRTVYHTFTWLDTPR